jgi:hypothetical protein
MEFWVLIFIAFCAFAGQAWAFRCCQELRKVRAELEAMRRSGASLPR